MASLAVSSSSVFLFMFLSAQKCLLSIFLCHIFYNKNTIPRFRCPIYHYMNSIVTWGFEGKTCKIVYLEENNFKGMHLENLWNVLNMNPYPAGTSLVQFENFKISKIEFQLLVHYILNFSTAATFIKDLHLSGIIPFSLLNFLYTKNS